MTTARCLLGGLTLCLVLAGCSTDERTEGSPPETPTGSPTSPTAEATPEEQTSEQPSEPRRRQPVLFVTHATLPRLALTRPQARHVLRGELSSRRVVAAPGMPVGPDVPVLRSATAVRRQVERDPGTVGVLPARSAVPTVRAAVVAGVDPLRDPRSYPLLTRGPRPARPTTLTVVGDLMLTRGVPDAARALRPLSDRLRSADVTVGNLESTLSRDGTPHQGGDSFGADLAAASRAAVVARHGTTFGLLGFNAIGETPEAAARQSGALSISMPPRTGPLDVAELRRVQRLVRDLARRVDVVVVVPHWGEQYTHAPWAVQRLVARRLVDAGADLVAGGHPHWVQGLDAYRGAVAAHSLGNYVFDMDFATETQQGVLLETTFWGDRLVGVDLVPYRMGPGFAPAPAVPEEAADILADVWSTSTGPFRAR